MVTETTEQNHTVVKHYEWPTAIQQLKVRAKHSHNQRILVRVVN